MWQRKIILLIALIICNTAIYAQKEDNSLPFKGGERLEFVLNYTWGGVVTDVATASCSLTYKDSVYYSVLTGKTKKFYDWFFKVRERFESKFREKDLRPVYFFRSAAEGKYRMKNVFHFNNEDYTVHSHTQKYDRTPKDTLLQGTPNTYDLLTLFYMCRTMDVSKLTKDKKEPIEFVIDREIYHLYFIYRGRETKKIPGLGTFKTLKFAAKVVAGSVFNGKDDMLIWVTDDKNMIPVFFESPILVGKMQGRLSKVVGNKYPITSKTK